MKRARRFCCLLLCLLFLPRFGAFCVAEALPALYTGRMRLTAKLFTDHDEAKGINQIGAVPEKARVEILAVEPAFVLVRYAAGNLTGYVKRTCIDDVTVINPAETPPYGVEFNQCIAVVAAQDAPVESAPGGGVTLATLHAGAKIACIGLENGYAKLIYHRQYAYIDSRLLKGLTRVYPAPETAGTDAPIAAYTSFYKTTTDESNQGRMINIAVACEKLCALPLGSGADLDFNRDLGPYRASSGYKPATVLIDGKAQQGYGGGTCQVSSTLYNVVLQLPGLTVLQRRAHGNNGASYLPIGVDAAVGNSTLNFRFRNEYPFPIRIDASAQDGALTIAIYRAEE